MPLRVVNSVQSGAPKGTVLRMCRLDEGRTERENGMRKLLIVAIASTMLLGACANTARQASVSPELRALHDGLQAYRRGEIMVAEGLFKKILETQPNNPFAHLNLGAVNGHLSQGGDAERREMAIVHYNKAIEVGEGVTASQVLPGVKGGAEGDVINQRKSVADVARANLKRLGA